MQFVETEQITRGDCKAIHCRMHKAISDWWSQFFVKHRPFNIDMKKSDLQTLNNGCFFLRNKTLYSFYSIIDYFFIVKNINNLFTPTVNFDVSKIETWHVLRGEYNLVGAWWCAFITFVCFFWPTPQLKCAEEAFSAWLALFYCLCFEKVVVSLLECIGDRFPTWHCHYRPIGRWNRSKFTLLDKLQSI